MLQLPEARQYCFPDRFSMSSLPEELSAYRRYSLVQTHVDCTAASDAIKQGVEKAGFAAQPRAQGLHPKSGEPGGVRISQAQEHRLRDGTRRGAQRGRRRVRDHRA